MQMTERNRMNDCDRDSKSRWRSPQRILKLGALLGLLGPVLFGMPVTAAEFPACQPPDENEYLLLVIGQTEPQREQIQQLAPSGATATVCQYFNDVVVRVGGFATLETANAWAQYLVTEVESARVFVARPPQETPSPVATAVANSSTYNPQVLNLGYAVLVDYDNRPEVALEVQQAISRSVGLAAYRQHPYLLAIHTPDLEAANQVFKTLSDRSLGAMIVDGRQVMLLTPNVTANVSE